MNNEESFEKNMMAAEASIPKKEFDESTATEFEVTDGKTRDENEERKAAAKTLESLLGVEHTNPYGTNDVGVFQDKLSDMNLSDMQSLATRVGITPENNKMVLVKNLTRAFVDFVRKENCGHSFPQHVCGPDSPNRDSTVKLFKDGF